MRSKAWSALSRTALFVFVVVIFGLQACGPRGSDLDAFLPYETWQGDNTKAKPKVAPPKDKPSKLGAGIRASDDYRDTNSGSSGGSSGGCGD